MLSMKVFNLSDKRLQSDGVAVRGTLETRQRHTNTHPGPDGAHLDSDCDPDQLSAPELHHTVTPHSFRFFTIRAPVMTKWTFEFLNELLPLETAGDDILSPQRRRSGTIDQIT